MKIIPKLAGGGVSSFFTTFNAIQTPIIGENTPTRTINSESDSITLKDSKQQKDDSDKGKLTEKDLFNMLKDVDALPNEMKSIVRNLQEDLSTANLIGQDYDNIALTYLNNLYKIKIAKANKEKFSDAIKTAKDNGSFGEVAITSTGNLLAQDEKGKITELTLEQYIQNKSSYNLLTNSNLAWLRQYSNSTTFPKSDILTDTIQSGVGFTSFTKMLKDANISLGSYKYEEQGLGGAEALQGLQTFQKLSKEDQIKYLQAALPGKYAYSTKTDSNGEQIKAYVNYLRETLPANVKTWAAIKTGIIDPEAATQKLVIDYLSGQLKQDSAYKVKYLGTDNKLTKSGSSSSEALDAHDKSKVGFWEQMQTGQGGDIQTNTVLVGRTSMQVDGNYYGTTPGLDEDKSLSSYIHDSNIGYIMKNAKGITFGDQAIDPQSFKDVMINPNAGAIRVILPKTSDGRVNFDIMNQYSKVVTKLKQLGVKQGTKDYEIKKAYLLKKIGLGYLVGSNGLPNPKYFGAFLVLEGVSSDKAYNLTLGKKEQLHNSDFVKDVSSDDELYTRVEDALSSKNSKSNKYEKYELDHNWVSFNNNKLYRANIYIPINNNIINGANADENKISYGESKARQYQQQVIYKREKANNYGEEGLYK